MYQEDLQMIGALDWRVLEVEAANESEGICDCCGTTTRRVWGFVHDDIGTIAAYYVGWTLGVRDHGAAFDLLIGSWGEGATSENRCVVSLVYRTIDETSAFCVIDHSTEQADFSELARTVLHRDQVIGTPVAGQVFAIVDAIFVKDPRLDEIRDWS